MYDILDGGLYKQHETDGEMDPNTYVEHTKSHGMVGKRLVMHDNRGLVMVTVIDEKESLFILETKKP